jgi:uncharacterized protein (DUF58 family)
VTAQATPTHSAQPGSSASFIDPQALMRIKSLQWRAKVVVEGFMSGLHRSPYHGFSVEFSEYREYSPGDDLRYLDWRLLARSDRYYIKRFEEETNLRCYLLVDRSRSMGYGSGDYSKDEYARTVAATLAYFLLTQRDAVGLLTFDQHVIDYLPARFRPGHLHRLMLCLERQMSGTGTSLEVPVAQVARTVNKRGLIVLISDFLAPVESLQKQLGYLRSRGHDILLLRVLDPREVDFRFDNASMFQDLESGQQRYVDPQSARQEYLQRFQQHAQQVQEICDDQEVDLYQLLTDQPLDRALFDFLSSGMRRNRRVMRRSGDRSLKGGASS